MSSHKSIPVTVTYLEQTTRPLLNTPRPTGKLALLRAEKPPLHFYRYLYKLVGEPYNWISRTLMKDEDLQNILHHPNVFIYALYINGVPGGFSEIDARHPRLPEIKFFGLAPDFIGKGYGRFFLAQIIDLAWTAMTEPPAPQSVSSQATAVSSSNHGPERVILETCTLDHPAALPLYQKFGFTVFDQRQGEVPVLDTYQPLSSTF